MPVLERTLSLPDGRAVAVAEYGDPDGLPLLNCHGGLLCRHDVASADASARALGVRIVSPDRPGVGGSDRLPSRTLLDWPADVVALADALGIGSFAVLGWSMGGQYALALARALPERVRALTVVAGVLPLDDPGVRAGLSALDRRLTLLSCRTPPLARAAFATMREVARRAPERFARASAREAGRADAAEILRDPLAYSAAVAEGLRDPRGAVEEYRVFAAPWGFAPEDVQVPAHIWWGTEDRFVPRADVEALERRIPGSRLTIVEGAGHFVARARWPAVLGDLAARTGRDATSRQA
ncbi:MAG: alpha/beta hydrolase [Solirubrobacteraceae bacterium]